MLVVAPDRKSATHAKLLEAGADQVVGKPYSPRELRASVVAVLRRIRSRDQREEPTRGAALAPPTVQTLDELALALHLTETERRLLRCMIAKPDGVSASALLSTVFPGLHYGPDSSHVRVHIHRLRRKLEPVGLVVKGMRGYGYRVFRGRTASNLLHAGAWTTM
jgi:DNA-binding response OmpR family regulator